MRNKYTKYHERMSSIFKKADGFLDDALLAEFSKYLDSRLEKEDTFLLYRYMDTTYVDELDKLYLKSNGWMNDIYEGLPKTDVSIEAIKEILPRIKPWMYLKCFTESYNNNLMWAHYANHSRGICVEYDITKLKQNNNKTLELFPVVYKKERMLGIELNELADCLNNIIEEDWVSDTRGVFIQKNFIWKYEKEWRIILNEKLACEYKLEKIKDMYIIKYPCISAIYLGVDIRKEDSEKILKLYGKNVPIYQMGIDNETYNLYASLVNECILKEGNYG